MMAAFSRAIFGDRVAQPVHVVEVDVGDDRHAAIPGVRRIEPPTEPDLDERDVGPDLGEAGEDDGGQQLELGRVAVAGCDRGRRRRGRGRPAARSRPGRSGGRRPGSARGRSRGVAWGWTRPGSRRLAAPNRRARARCPCRWSRRSARRGPCAPDGRARAAGRASARARAGCRTGHAPPAPGAPRRR